MHVRCEFNPSDIGSRPEKVQDSDVGPDSIWYNGHEWMQNSLESAISDKIVTPAENLKMKDDEEVEYDKGLVLEKIPEILVRGHSAFVSDRVSKMASRALFSDYIFSPTKYSFSKCIYMTAWMLKPFKVKRMARKPGKLYPDLNFRIFSTLCARIESIIIS